MYETYSECEIAEDSELAREISNPSNDPADPLIFLPFLLGTYPKVGVCVSKVGRGAFQ